MGGRGASSASSDGRSASGAKTFDDLRTYMQDHYGIAVDHSIDKLDFETVKQGIAGVDDVLKQLPQLRQSIKTISADMSTTAYAFARARYGANGLEFSLHLGGWAYGSSTKMRDSLKRDGTFHPANMDARGIMSHEVGHIAEFTIAMKHGSSAGESFRYIKKQTYATKIVGDACKDVKRTSYGRGKKNDQLVSGISGYASRNRSEALAEAVGDYMTNGSKSNPLSQSIWAKIKNELG